MAPATVSAAAPSPAPIGVVSSRHIQIPDTRILSMSPDGRLIAAVRPAVGYRRGGLCTFDVETLAEVACASLEPLEAGLRLESVAWSPDSTHLALAEEAFTFLKDGDLWLMDGETGALTNLDDDGYSGTLFGSDVGAGTITVPTTPTFTPDGSAVTYSRSTFRDGQRAGNDIATVPITGGPATHLVQVSATEPGLAYFGMRWTPDGGDPLLLGQRRVPESAINGIWAVEADGTGQRFVAGTTDTDVGEPAITQVSSDGDRLLAWYPRAEGFRPVGVSAVDHRPSTRRCDATHPGRRCRPPGHRHGPDGDVLTGRRSTARR